MHTISLNRIRCADRLGFSLAGFAEQRVGNLARGDAIEWVSRALYTSPVPPLLIGATFSDGTSFSPAESGMFLI